MSLASAFSHPLLRLAWLLNLALIIVGCEGRADTAATATAEALAAIDAQTYAANARIGRAINLGNGLEAPNEGAWGLYLKEQYFVDIAEAGFDSVRIPIRWSAYAGV